MSETGEKDEDLLDVDIISEKENTNGDRKPGKKQIN